MKANISDPVLLHVEEAGNSYVINAVVEDSLKGDIIQAKVTSISDNSGKQIEEPGTLPYRVGKVDSFDRNAIIPVS